MQDPAATSAALRSLYRLTTRVVGERTLPATLQAVVDGVVEAVGFQVAAVNYRRADGRFEMVAVAGSDEARDALLGTVSAPGAYDEEFARADAWGSLRFVPHDRLGPDDAAGWVPDVAVADGPDAWHPLDALFAPLTSTAGELVGVLSVDLPRDGRRPGPLQRELLEMFAAHAGVAIDNARLAEELRVEHERVAEAARHDSLTGLLNRPALRERLDAAVAQHRRGAVLFCDLDGFKQVNDALGHAAGDEVLAQVAARVAGEIRSSDVAGRFGGDELVVVVDDIGEDDLGRLVARIEQAVAAPITYGDRACSVTVSIGVAWLDDVLDADAVLRRADSAMYEAKTARAAGATASRPS